MVNEEQHLISVNISAREALQSLENLPPHAKRTLFLVSQERKLLGTLTDGDIRRGLLSGLEISEEAEKFINKKFKYLTNQAIDVDKIKDFKSLDITLVPILDENGCLVQVLDLKKTKTVLPVSALIMAGGRGQRLQPLTDATPKPMLLVGGKPIIEYNVDRLISFGIKEIFISVKYLKEQIMDYFGDGSSKGVKIRYIEETEPLGTLGCLSLVQDLAEETLLVMNSDLLTNIDFEKFFKFFKESGADMSLVSIPYTVNVPYAVLETENYNVKAFSEKPSYTYYSNGGIYLMKSAFKNRLEKNVFYNATDLMDEMIDEDGKALTHFPLLDYWLDIGKHQDFLQAQEDIKKIHI
ncbi:MAG: dTDP-glucose pyrophosphorylase [Saprospiraceae bacterium]|jgi:dTDP-glucose pyrophosphorylase